MTATRARVHLVMLVAVVVGIAGCAAHQAELKASLVTLDAARDGFAAWNEQHELAIVAASTTKDEALSAIGDYEKKRAPFIAALDVAYHALAAASVSRDDAAVALLIADIAALEQDAKALGFTWPGGK